MFSFCLWQILNRNRDSSDQATFFQSSIVQFVGEIYLFIELFYTYKYLKSISTFFPICSEDEWYSVGSSTVVDHLPQGCVCCSFTNALLHTSVVTSGYFSQNCSSISLNQLAHSPLTSSINKAFSLTGLLHTGCFSLFTPFFINPRKSQ